MRRIAALLAVVGLLTACGQPPTAPPTANTATPTPAPMATLPTEPAAGLVLTRAEVTDVSVAGEQHAYTFNVTISSPDTGCDTYVDWWEVVTPEGEVVYRQTLLHSHVDEQPFTRPGGPVTIEASADVIVRAHMNTTGYSEAAMRGSVSGGFTHTNLEPGFAADVESLAPQALECAF